MMTADQIRSLQPELAALLAFFRPCFKRTASFGHWQRYIVGLITDLKRKSIEPIALAAGVAVRTLQEFLADFAWDHQRADTILRQLVMDRRATYTYRKTGRTIGSGARMLVSPTM